MAGTRTTASIDPKSGFCSRTKIFHSLRARVTLPPLSQPLSFTQFAFCLLRASITTTPSDTTFLINAATVQRITYGDLLRQINSLTLSLQKQYFLSKNDVAFVLCPPSFQIPVLYLSLLAVGVIISPANPLGSTSEISHQIQICKPSIAFATSDTSTKLPHSIRTILIDSPEFLSLLSRQDQNDAVDFTNSTPVINQSDSAVIFYSSGTTGKVKGVLLTHRNTIALVAVIYHSASQIHRIEPSMPKQPIELMFLPLFHLYGFFALMKAICMAQTSVLMEKFDFETMLKTVEKYKISYMPVSPPIVVALTKSELTKNYDLSSLHFLRCGGASLSKEVSEKFQEKFPNIKIWQGYASTESGLGGEIRGNKEAERNGSVGRLRELMEAKIVNPVTGEGLPPGQKGELLLRGPTIMKGYVGNDTATAETLDSEGWLKTGDLCYFDSDGFLFIIDRLKELIKYKAYQVPPAELEQLLQSNTEIADAAVIPYPDEEAGQIPMAIVVRKPGSSITEAQVMDFVAKQVTPQKKIRRVAFVRSIPKSPAGKLIRRELVSHALSNSLSKL